MKILASAMLASTLAGAVAAQHNTLLIVADDFGIDTLALYKLGNAPAPTPNIDALAAKGVLFRNAYAYPACSPTRASIHTGRYGFRTRVMRAGQTLPFSETTLPELLTKAGIANGLIGKWHLAGNVSSANAHPNQTGWQHFAGSLPGFFTNGETYYSWRKVVNGSASQTTNYATSENVDDALAWIKAQSKTWVCSVNFNAPHSPFHAPPSGLHSYNLTGKNPRTQPLPFFKAMIQAMDTELGRLVKGLGATIDKTNIIFIGDNGTSARVSEPPFTGAHAKFTVYEGGVKVPLIVSGPIVKSQGREESALVASVDLFHSILEMSGIDARQAVPASVALDGVSLVPYLTSTNQASKREFVYVEHQQSRRVDSAIRNDRYKLLRKGNAEEFYDLGVDPFERKNLLASGLSIGERQEYDELAAEHDRIHGKASWFAYGAGCAGTAGTPKLTATSRPQLATTLQAVLSGLGTSPAALGMLGFSNTDFGPFKLPLDLTGAGMPGCSLLASLDSTVPLSVQTGAAAWNLSIPNDGGLLGLRFYQQGLVLDASANAFGAVLSNAAQGTIERN